ncbi:ABC superfamily ATP binding cassette transporter solute-binding protein, partial [Actinomyces sp. oral taxon 178 str. F0338]
MTNARATRVVLLAVSALALAACTPAVSANAPADPFVDPIVPQGGSAQSADQGTGSASAPRKGSGAVGVALVGGAQLPEQVVSAFTKDTGFTVGTAAYDAVGDVPAQGTDVVLGLDGADALAAAG